MKLRNKKTGEICEAEAREDGIYIKASWSDEEQWFRYDLVTLAGDWDYYVEPVEPLIKDEKIRKAVRAWLAIQEQPIVRASITYYEDSDGFFDYRLYGYIERARISNGKSVENKNLTAIWFEFRSLEEIKFDMSRDYAITELCGEEENEA